MCLLVRRFSLVALCPSRSRRDSQHQNRYDHTDSALSELGHCPDEGICTFQVGPQVLAQFSFLIELFTKRQGETPGDEEWCYLLVSRMVYHIDNWHRFSIQQLHINPPVGDEEAFVEYTLLKPP